MSGTHARDLICIPKCMFRRSIIMASKDISSYFAKPSPSTPGTKRPASSVTGTGNGTGSSPAQPASQPTPTPDSSGKPKASGLSEAMRKAILEGVQEGEIEREAKRPKIEVEKSRSCLALYTKLG
jgi:hypothetical protein